MNSSNRVLGLLAFLGGVTVWVLCLGIDTTAEVNALPPGFFPQVLAVILALLGICLFAQGKGQAFSAVWSKVTALRNLCLVGGTLIYTFAFGYVDYRLLTPLYILALLWVLGSRKPAELVLVPLGTTAALYVVFRYGFLVLLPSMG